MMRERPPPPGGEPAIQGANARCRRRRGWGARKDAERRERIKVNGVDRESAHLEARNGK